MQSPVADLSMGLHCTADVCIGSHWTADVSMGPRCTAMAISLESGPLCSECIILYNLFKKQYNRNILNSKAINKLVYYIRFMYHFEFKDDTE